MPASALGASAETESPSLQAQANSERVSLGRVDLVAVPIAVQPASVEVGVPCGMEDMCGQDPCLCGAVDDWGACACNGRTVALPSFSLSDSTNDIVDCVELFGAYWLVPKAEGSTHATLRADLPHHQHAEVAVDITVQPLGWLDVAKVAAVIAAGLALLAGVAAGVYALVRAIRKRGGRDA